MYKKSEHINVEKINHELQRLIDINDVSEIKKHIKEFISRDVLLFDYSQEFKVSKYRILDCLVEKTNTEVIEYTLSLYKDDSHVVGEFIEAGFKNAIKNNKITDLKFYDGLQFLNLEKHKAEGEGLFKQKLSKENMKIIISDYIFGECLDLAINNGSSNKEVIGFIIKKGNEYKINDDLFYILANDNQNIKGKEDKKYHKKF